MRALDWLNKHMDVICVEQFNLKNLFASSSLLFFVSLQCDSALDIWQNLNISFIVCPSGVNFGTVCGLLNALQDFTKSALKTVFELKRPFLLDKLVSNGCQ